MENEKNSIDKIDELDETDRAAIEALLSGLDKGIDDMEAGSVFPVEKAFRMIADRLDMERGQ